MSCMSWLDLSVRMNQHLRVALNTLVELLVCPRRLIDLNLVGDDKRRVSTAGDDHVAQVAIVLLDVALPRSKCETLSVSLASVEAST